MVFPIQLLPSCGFSSSSSSRLLSIKRTRLPPRSLPPVPVPLPPAASPSSHGSHQPIPDSASSSPPPSTRNPIVGKQFTISPSSSLPLLVAIRRPCQGESKAIRGKIAKRETIWKDSISDCHLDFPFPTLCRADPCYCYFARYCKSQYFMTWV